MFTQWRFFTLLEFLTLLLSISQSTTAHPHPEFPCKPPQHSSYAFCNTSLPISTRAQSLISLLTLDEKIQQLSNNVTPIQRLGIPAYEWWSESLHGIADNGPGVSFNGSISSATSFPQVLVTAASFNRSLWFAIAEAIAVEARAMYNVGQAGLTFWAPNINIFRDPRWGRGQETPGEDPMVAAAYAIEYVRGFQGENWNSDGSRREDNGVLEGSDDSLMLSACCKHFTAYDLEKWGEFSRYNFNAVVSQQDLEDTYQPPFRSCIQEGRASCLMCSYNSVNGVPACARKDLLQKAREDWGFKGYITSDCDAVATVYEYHGYVKTPEDAAADVLKAGTDIDCGTYLLRHTQSAIEQGKIQEEDIDKALLNLFSVQLRLGLYDGDPIKGQFGKLGPLDVCTQQHKELALEAARQGIVLLKNDYRFLPLNKSTVGSVAVIGPAAHNTSILGGGYTGTPCNPISYFEGLKEYIEKTSYAPGCLDIQCTVHNGLTEAIQNAKEADVVIVVVGLDLSQENEERDRFSLLLPGKQTDLISAVADSSKTPILLILTGGGPLDVSFAKDDPRIAGIIWVGYPGETGGQALAELIFGEFNPGGRLPMTWYPESFIHVPMTDMSMRPDPSRSYPGRTYRFYTGDNVYRFGYGLSYTNYTYSFLSVPDKLSLLGSSQKHRYNIRTLRQSIDGHEYVPVDEVESCDALRFHTKILVTNNGDMDGSQVVMLFSRMPATFRGAPQKQLIGFTRLNTLSHSATATSILVDPCKHLSSVNEHGTRILPLGNHILMLEGSEHSISIQT
ncbi:probable beta-D-xylosidase 6 [Telopea speciosissima]|uniref:probable beta-D-xylosidase 6 n=1 Tax=Telopea speciosissima TaxID=54955 RepID=UPI001CC5E43F|nr:probable beta-D-xylosidase 6 [Telopea speciosissima]